MQQEEVTNMMHSEIGKGIKVMIVDDDPAARLIYTRILEKQGYQLSFALNGIEAVEVYKANPDIDLILMDIAMPRMDGLSATREIRKLNSKVVIIAQTANYNWGGKENSLLAGCTDYMMKPIDFNELNRLISKYLDPQVLELE